ncbi:MAG: magnesium transporter CorA family protein [Candidatus Omnitrophica bacterium]|nr:magnesium transporter CorA family protein [Candidatus Omnitrophota bacterium]
MKSFFEIKDGCVVLSNEEAGKIVVYALPNEAEKKELIETLKIDQHTVESALDPDEISRVEFLSHYLSIIWKRPNTFAFKEQMSFEVSSLGIFLNKEKVTLVLGESTIPFSSKEFHGVTSLNSFVLRFLLQTIHHFLGHLKGIRLINAELQSKLNMSMENLYLLQMFNLNESLIYYLNALEANASALVKLRNNVERVGFSKEEQEMLDDIMIEHQQCSKQTQIYSDVLSGLMDARGNIINNNMNIFLKNLTLINVVFLPLNLIAGVGGMSEYTRITENVMNWELAYGLFFIAMIALGFLTWYFLVKQLNHQKIIKRKNPRKSP